MDASKTTKSTKILVLESFRLYGKLPELGSGGSGGKGSKFCDPFNWPSLLPVSIVPWLRLMFKSLLFFN